MSRFMRRAQRRTEERGRVLALFDADPHPLYGLDIIRRANVRSGRLYPILLEFEKRGLIVSEWSHHSGRRYYQKAGTP